MDTGLAMTSGVDIWLNNPIRPLEASGTSGMKAAMNGVPNCSILDGWWPEGCEHGVNGWAIGKRRMNETMHGTRRTSTAYWSRKFSRFGTKGRNAGPN